MNPQSKYLPNIKDLNHIYSHSLMKDLLFGFIIVLVWLKLGFILTIFLGLALQYKQSFTNHSY